MCVDWEGIGLPADLPVAEGLEELDSKLVGEFSSVLAFFVSQHELTALSMPLSSRGSWSTLLGA